ncbi:protein lin-28 homolog [Schistocerca serialis cubense]|uniref:protein lin-28 homolog n=1 Tax=Schistocerca serialis cubense TaxID=2023355 RepID=UPI00214E7161|nr:protein lin-28 homolog [Schistocerca serialis cubense]
MAGRGGGGASRAGNPPRKLRASAPGLLRLRYLAKCTPMYMGVPRGGGSVGGGTSPGGDETRGRRRGRCKWFNVAKGWGFITPDDGGQDVFVHQSVIQMTGFRSLGDDEEVEFECKASDKGLEATLVTGPSGADCCGSHRRPVSKKRFRKISRCYNCGEFANHIAAKCTMGPQPKRCHHCKSQDHLIADCPSRPDRNKKSPSMAVPSAGAGGEAEHPETSAAVPPDGEASVLPSTTTAGGE